ncbi:hypothetical protein [Photobacterium damselae]|uniref:hypothetical protein n=1 Tax=Photobacterium damselae TaxID=38293 RepID=UPI003B6804CB
MDSTEKKLKVIIPQDVQYKIDHGEYILRGTQVRDNLGKIVCNLESLDTADNCFFSPNIFLMQNNYTFISQSVISKKLTNELKELKCKCLAIDNKLDEVIDFQTSSLMAKDLIFNELFSMFQENSTLTDNVAVFTSGITAAAEIAINLDNYIQKYLNNTTIYYETPSWDTVLYSDHLKKSGFKPKIIKTNFNLFSDSHAFYFIYSYINIINNINILSLCLDNKIYPKYKDNLLEVRNKLIKLINHLINGFDDYNTIYNMCYSTDFCNNYHPINNISEIVEFDSNRTINDLIVANYSQKVTIDYDINRVKSLQTCISLIQEIDNLLSRCQQLSEINLEEIPNIINLVKLTLISDNT